MMMRQILSRMLGPLIIALLLFVVPLAVLHERDARAQVIELVERRAASIALVAGVPADFADWDTMALRALPGVEGEQTALVDLDNRVLAGALLPEAVLDSPAVADARKGELSGSIDGGTDLVVGAAPVVADGSVVATAVVVVPASEVGERTRATLLLLAGAALALIAAATMAGRALARSIVHPIEELDDVASRLSAGDLNARVSVKAAPLELRRLGQHLNEGADQLARSIDLQRTFVADASHQLRSPLTALRLQLENAELAAPNSTAHLQGALREIERLTAIVDGLLALARTESAGSDPVTIEVTEIALDRVRAAATAADHRVDVTMADVDDVTAWCIPGGLEQILDNLLDNAVRASPTGALVEVSVDDRGDHAVIRVSDRGPGLSDAQREAAFERFWQASTGAGSGLGLPIAAAIARASHGSIELLPRSGGGLIAEVRLPIASPIHPTSARSERVPRYGPSDQSSRSSDDAGRPN